MSHISDLNIYIYHTLFSALRFLRPSQRIWAFTTTLVRRAESRPGGGLRHEFGRTGDLDLARDLDC